MNRRREQATLTTFRSAWVSRYSRMGRGVQVPTHSQKRVLRRREGQQASCQSCDGPRTVGDDEDLLEDELRPRERERLERREAVRRNGRLCQLAGSPGSTTHDKHAAPSALPNATSIQTLLSRSCLPVAAGQPTRTFPSTSHISETAYSESLLADKPYRGTHKREKGRRCSNFFGHGWGPWVDRWSSYELLLKHGAALLEIDPQLGAGQEGREGDQNSCRANTAVLITHGYI